MANSEDCPTKTNNGDKSDTADATVLSDQAASDRAKDLVKLIVVYKRNQPKDEAHNAERLHASNRRKLRETGAVIDEHRAGEGRDAYNTKRRAEYEPAGPSKRAYVTGLSEEAKAERRRERDRLRKVEARKAATQEQKATEAARKKQKRRDNAELEAIAARADGLGS